MGLCDVVAIVYVDKAVSDSKLMFPLSQKQNASDDAFFSKAKPIRTVLWAPSV